MKAIFLKELLIRKWALIGYCLVGFSLTLVYVSYFDSLESDFAVELFSLVWPLLASFLVVSWAGNTLAGEVERGTLGTILNQPIERTQIYFAKYYAGLAALGAFVTATLVVMAPLAMLMDLDISLHNVLAVAILCLLFGMAVLGLAFIGSAMSSERSTVYFSISGILVLMYGMNVVASLQDRLAWLGKASLFHYFDVGTALRGGTLDQTGCLVLMAVGVGTMAAGAYWFKRRDIAV